MNVVEKFSPLIVGHRGAPLLSRENTLESFRAALLSGADGVEFDVRRTSDGELVTHHDPVTESGDEIASLSASGGPGALDTLDDALGEILSHRPAVVNVEVKDLPGEPGFDADRTTARLVAERLLRYPPGSGLLVSSFDPGALEIIARDAPTLPLALLTATGHAIEGIEIAAALGAVALHPADADVSSALIVATHAAGLAVNVWTVNDLDRARQLAEWGVDALVTDTPDTFVSAFRSGG